MLKADAIQLLGGTVASAAKAIGVSYQAVDKWPDVLTPRIEDRVVAALWRMNASRINAPRINAPGAPKMAEEVAHS